MPAPSVVAIVLVRSPDAVRTAAARFAGAGFTVGPASGPTFSIEAPTGTFERTFGVAPVPAGDGGWTTGWGDEFPLSGLADDLRRVLIAVSLERPVGLHEDRG